MRSSDLDDLLHAAGCRGEQSILSRLCYGLQLDFAYMWTIRWLDPLQQDWWLFRYKGDASLHLCRIISHDVSRTNPLEYKRLICLHPIMVLPVRRDHVHASSHGNNATSGGTRETHNGKLNCEFVLQRPWIPTCPIGLHGR